MCAGRCEVKGQLWHKCEHQGLKNVLRAPALVVDWCFGGTLETLLNNRCVDRCVAAAPADHALLCCNRRRNA
eukprot:SAG11_NODE_14244_length_620_cov_0.792706_2_plen_72_part_00